MSMQSLDLGESTIHHDSSVISSGGNARNRRKEEKRNSRTGSPYGGGGVNPRQAWLTSMQQGQGFNNITSSYTRQENTPSPRGRSKPVHRASHLDKEEMYDEIQRLKELAAAHAKEKTLQITKITKLERELSKKDKLLDDTYSQTQSVYGGLSERSGGSKSIETNATITGLRQKCHKYECLLREKDNEVKAMKSDLKSTRLQELEIMCETYYQEITRLTRVLDQKDGDQTTPRTSTPRTSPRASSALYSEKERLLEGKIQKLELDNATLKKQIVKTNISRPVGQSTGVISEYASLSRPALEEQHQLRTKELFEAQITIEELRTQCSVGEDAVKLLTAKQNKNKENTEKLAEGREKLEQKLASVDGEREAQKLVIRRLNKTVRLQEDGNEKLKKQIDKEQASSKEQLVQKTNLISELEQEIEQLNQKKVAEKGVTVEKGKITARSKSPVKTKTAKAKDEEEDKDGKIDSLQTKNGRDLKSKSRDVKISSEDEMPEEESRVKESKLTERATKRKNTKDLEKEREKRKEERQAQEQDEAATLIQRNYRNHSMVKSACLLQRVLRGHAARSRVAEQEHDTSAQVIQTALKSYSVKSEHIKSLNKENEEPSKQLHPRKETAENRLRLNKTGTPKTSDARGFVKQEKPLSEKPAQSPTKLDTNSRNLSLKKEDRGGPPAKKEVVSSPRKEALIREESTDEDDLIMM